VFVETEKSYCIVKDTRTERLEEIEYDGKHTTGPNTMEDVRVRGTNIV
jgi:hypothetical protein